VLELVRLPWDEGSRLTISISWELGGEEEGGMKTWCNTDVENWEGVGAMWAGGSRGRRESCGVGML